MDLKATFGTDKALETEGTWLPIGDGAEIKIARSTNPDYKKTLRRLLAPHKAAIRSESLSDDVTEPLIVRAMAAHILIGWRGIFMDGAELPYSRENAELVLRQFPDFRELVATLAQERDTFKQAETEAAVESGKKSSRGS